MPTFQNCELLSEHKIFHNEILTTAEETNQCSDPEEKQVEHDTELYQIRVEEIAVSY